MTAVRNPGAAGCPRCGETRPEGARFCPRCGEDLVAATPTLATGPQPGPPVPLPAPVSPPEAVPPPVVPPPVVPPPAPALAPTLGPVQASPATWSPSAPSPYGTPVFAPGATLPGGPTAVGRRASGAGWVVVVGVALVFMAASLGVIMIAQRSIPAEPLAQWDRTLRDPVTVSNFESFEIEAEAVNRGGATTGRLWMVIDWRPDDRAFDPDAVGRFVGCEPSDCRYRDDIAEGRTLVYWPGLPVGGRNTYAVTARLSGLDPGSTFHYRVEVGTGADEGSLRDTLRWSLDMEVR